MIGFRLEDQLVDQARQSSSSSNDQTCLMTILHQGSAKESFLSNSFLVRTKTDFGKRFFFRNLFSKKENKIFFLKSFFAQKNENLLRKSFFAQKNKNLSRKSFFAQKNKNLLRNSFFIKTEKIFKIFSRKLKKREKIEFSPIFFENLQFNFVFLKFKIQLRNFKKEIF